MFADGTVLHFKEYLQLHPTSIRLKYAYHYVTATGSLIFRYDNARAPAARDLLTYPHHRHSLRASKPPLAPRSRKHCAKPPLL